MESSITDTTAPRLPSSLFTASIVVVIFAILSSRTHIWAPELPLLLPSSRYGIIAAALLALLPLIIYRLKPTSLRIDPAILGWGVVLVFFTDWLCRSYNLFQGPSVRAEILVLSILSFYIIRDRHTWIFNAFVPWAIILLASCFFFASHGRLLFSDDHPVFLYRLLLLKENFPFIPFYNPLWNGGIDARDFFATGALNVFLLFAPILYICNVMMVYNFLVALIAFILVPLATYLAAKIEELPSPIPAIASILSLTSSLAWYKWAFKFGTIGFIVSAALVPLNLALLSKVLSKERTISLKEVWLTAIACTLMLLWSLSGIALLPLLLLGAVSIKTILQKPRVLLLIALLGIFNLPWMTVFISVSKVKGFVTAEAPQHTYRAMAATSTEEAITKPSEEAIVNQPAKQRSLKQNLKTLRDAAISTNPLLIFIGLPGIFFLRKGSKSVWLITSIWLLILGAVLASFKPQLELERMLLVMALCLCLPCATCLQKIFTRHTLRETKTASLIVPALLCGFLITGIFRSATMLLNRSVEQYVFAQDIVSDLSNAIKNHGGAGRTLFSGFVLHDLNNGHIAPLIFTTSKPLMASSPFHDRWRYTQIFPKSFLDRGRAGIEEYLNLFNVTAVVAHERYWRHYFAERNERFKLVWANDKFSLFTRPAYQSNYFLQGSGEILEQSTNSIRLKLYENSAVIKFNYASFLSSNTCTLAPFEVAPDIKFISLSNCPPNEEITLQSVSAFARIWGDRS